jgi:hypothetical protein
VFTFEGRYEEAAKAFNDALQVRRLCRCASESRQLLACKEKKERCSTTKKRSGSWTRGLPGVRSKQKRIGIGFVGETGVINDINSVVLVLTEALKYTDKMEVAHSDCKQPWKSFSMMVFRSLRTERIQKNSSGGKHRLDGAQG